MDLMKSYLKSRVPFCQIWWTRFNQKYKAPESEINLSLLQSVKTYNDSSSRGKVWHSIPKLISKVTYVPQE